MTEKNEGENPPAPLVPSEVDLKKLDGFMLDTVALLGSELVALSTGEEFKAAVLLWCRAWKQRPACSLPDNDRVLASFAMVAPSRWRKVKIMALHGFIKCADGRLYHPVLAKDALRADAARRQRSEAIKKRWEKEHGKSTEHDTEEIRPYYETATKTIPTVVRDGTGRDGTKEGKKEPASQDGEPPSLEAEVFRCGKIVLGKNSGGQITKLRNALDHDDALALKLLGQAKTKENPAEWIAGVIKNRGAPAVTNDLGLPTTPIEDLGRETDALYARLGVVD